MASNDFFETACNSNKQWAKKTAETDPSFFPTLAAGQHPQILWLGCSDSRVPETTVLGLKPGDVFVHRNIANILPSTDLSSQAVIAFAVSFLKVKHVVVCGHTTCGGANAALANQKLGLLDAWLTPLRRLRADNAKAWEGLDPKERALKLVEANVMEGVRTLKENSEVVQAVSERGLVVHGMVYDVATGELKELDCADEGEHVHQLRVDAFGIK